MSTRVHVPATSDDAAMAELLVHLRMVAAQRAGWSAYPEPSYVDRDGTAVVSVPEVIRARISVVRSEARRAQGNSGGDRYSLDDATNADPYYEAAWSLVRRGVLIPDRLGPNAELITVGTLFRLTRYGREWLARAEGEAVIPSQAGTFGRILATGAARFGPGYHVRSQEALACYQAQAYHACCTMCGAAAESITLALAIARSGDEATVLSEYLRSNGRIAIERRLKAGRNNYEQSEFGSFLTLLADWRNAAAHGIAVPIDEDRAFVAMLLLLRYVQFAVDRWDTLTAP